MHSILEGFISICFSYVWEVNSVGAAQTFSIKQFEQCVESASFIKSLFNSYNMCLFSKTDLYAVVVDLPLLHVAVEGSDKKR